MAVLGIRRIVPWTTDMMFVNLKNNFQIQEICSLS